jgi:uncharacterized repeat protein (TIGR03803 family)
MFPGSGLIVDASGNLFGTTAQGGAYNNGTVFEIAKTAGGYVSTPTIAVSFNFTNGEPFAGVIADASGNLFGTESGGQYGDGTVFEVTDSGFVPPPLFAGTPGKPNCHGQSIWALAQQYGRLRPGERATNRDDGLDAVAAALGYSSVQVLQNEISIYCAG